MGDSLPNYDAWLEAPYMVEACENPECDEGCRFCDKEMAHDHHISTDPRV